jgi:DNA-cytosine methyltransferase
MLQTKLKLLDLFSGLGGFSLGLESTGFFETIAFVEKDEFCQKVLKKNFKNIPIEGDIRNVKGDRYKADVITGGFPCQPFSVAGKRKGTDDDRYLWDETIRVVRECKPKWFIGENVEGLINIQDGMVLRQVQDDLEKEGFKVQCLIIPASGIGAWHQRKRIWIIGYNVSNSNTVQRPNEGNMRMMRKQVLQGNISKEEASTMVGKDVFKAHGKIKMYPTPSASCQMDVVAPPETVKQNSKGWSVTRVGTGTKFGAKLNDVVNKIEKMYPTPMARDYKDVSFNTTWKLGNKAQPTMARTVLKNNKLGGKLNPTFVEFLMGYPMNWTKIEPTE